MPKRIKDRSVEEYGVIAKLKLSDEQYSNIEKAVDRRKIYGLDPKPDNEVLDGGCSYLILYDKNQEVMKEVGGYMPSNEEFQSIRKIIFENIPIDEVSNIREKQVEYLEEQDKSI